MLYIITEDSNSAREFWKITVEEFIGSEYEVNNICRNRCMFKCKDCTTREELIDLDNNSMLAIHKLM